MKAKSIYQRIYVMLILIGAMGIVAYYANKLVGNDGHIIKQIDKVYKWIERISLIALIIYTLLTGFHTYLGWVYALWAVVFILRTIKLINTFFH